MLWTLYCAHFLLLYARLFLALFGVASVVAQCPRPLVLPVFAENLAVEARDLPPRVSVRVDQPSPLENVLEIRNSSQTPLYVLAKTPTADRPIEQLPVRIPPDLVPAYKIVADQAYQWQAGAWKSTGAEDITIATPRGGEYRRTDPAPLSTLIALAPGLEDRNVGLEAFAPPNLTLPAPQRSQLTFVYGDQVLVVPLTLTYEMNPAFVARSAEAQSCTLRVNVLTPSIHSASSETNAIPTDAPVPAPTAAAATSTPIDARPADKAQPAFSDGPQRLQSAPAVLALLLVLGLGVIGWTIWRRRRR